MAEEDIKPIPDELLDQLMQVPASTDEFMMAYRPCLVVLDDGTYRSRVYVVEAEAYFKVYGVLAWENHAERYLPIERVRRIQDSPDRLLAEHANVIYKAGESGMGYTVFTLVLKDGRRLPFVTGNAVDFPNWPPDASPLMVASVLPHEGREHFMGRQPDIHQKSAEFAWCLYRNPRRRQPFRHK